MLIQVIKASRAVMPFVLKTPFVCVASLRSWLHVKNTSGYNSDVSFVTSDKSTAAFAPCGPKPLFVGSTYGNRAVVNDVCHGYLLPLSPLCTCREGSLRCH